MDNVRDLLREATSTILSLFSFFLNQLDDGDKVLEPAHSHSLPNFRSRSLLTKSSTCPLVHTTRRKINMIVEK
jgi:hypothetical protein